MGLTELVIQQARTFCVMAAAGILVESLWQARAYIGLPKAVKEILYWILVAVILTAFLYYSSYGRISCHGIIGFLTGLLLWKKICCDIIFLWLKTGEAKSTKTTAASSIWIRRERKGWKKDGRRDSGKKKKPAMPQNRKREEKEPLEEAGTEGG